MLALRGAVAAYGRIEMANIKMKYQDTLYYSDTDSIFLDVPLPEDLVKNKLGHWKLEYSVKKAVFLAPKVYGLLLKDGSEIVKIKGSKVKLTFSDLEDLLQKDASKVITQDKWHRNLAKGNISIRQELYTLAEQLPKIRESWYNSNDKLVSTKPLVVSP